MKNLVLIAGIAALGLAVGCASNKSSTSAGAVGSCETKSECCKEKAAASPGAVGEKKDGCCASKASGSMGAVSEKKEGCSTTKAGCSASKTECTKQQ